MSGLSAARSGTAGGSAPILPGRSIAAWVVQPDISCRARTCSCTRGRPARGHVGDGDRDLVIYTRSEILKFEPKPPLTGLWPEILYEPDAYFTYHETTVGGAPYVVAIVSKRALFPTQAGRLEIKPFKAKVASLSSSPHRSSNLSSRSVTIRVKPLPGNPPPGFDPTYVGRFQVESSVDRNQIEASESLTLLVKVKGEGAIRRTEAPKLAFPGFSFRAPRDTQDSVDISSGLVRGERVYRYWTTPEQGGTLTIPPIELPYFDPHSGSYKVASSRPIPILVRGDPAAGPPAM